MTCKTCNATVHVTGTGAWRCPSCGASNGESAPTPANTASDGPVTYIVTGANGKEYPYLGDKPEIGSRVKIVLPGTDVHIKVKEVREA